MCSLFDRRPSLVAAESPARRPVIQSREPLSPCPILPAYPRRRYSYRYQDNLRPPLASHSLSHIHLHAYPAIPVCLILLRPGSRHA